MTPPVPVPPVPAGSPADQLDQLKWHLDRYDRFRVSTTNRASVVLSAGAILSAGIAVVLTQLLSGSQRLRPWLLVVVTVVVMASAALVVLSVISSSAVLVTRRNSRTMLAALGPLPQALIYNDTDTVAALASFAEFQIACAAQGPAEAVAAAQVDLWVGIQQHRARYLRLRQSVRFLQYAAIAFLVILTVAMIVNLVHRI